MTPAWMLQALLTAVLLGMAALAAERVAGWTGTPQRGIWAAAMLGSLALPALSLWAPGLLPDLGIVPDAAPAAPAPGPGSPRPLAGVEVSLGGPGGEAWPFRAGLSSLLALGWLASSLAMLGVVAWSYARLRAVRSGCEALEVDGIPVRVAERTGPAVVGLVRPVVVVPRWVLDAPAEERRLILLHEREHVAGRDTWLLFGGTLAVAAMPWSLPLWWQQYRLRLAVETDCDARVLARGVSRRAYGQVLIRTAGGSPGLPLLSPAWGESTLHLERRIRTMTAKRPAHPLLRSLPLLAVAAGGLAAACAVAGEGGSGDGFRQAAPARAEATAPAVPTVATGSARHLDTVIVSGRSRDPNAGSPGFVPRVPISFGEDGNLRSHPAVDGLAPGSSPWNAGLRNGDTILAVNGIDARHLRAWQEMMGRRIGTPYTLRIRRDGEEREIRAEVVSMRLHPRGSSTRRVPTP